MLGISVVVVSYNSEPLISPTLQCLFTQKSAENLNWEVILVNNNSTDKTVELAKELASKFTFTNFRIVDEMQPGTAYARFKGVAEAKFDIICFVDDDNRVANNFIATAFGLMQNQEIGILGCGAEGEYEEEPPEWFDAEKDAFAIGSLYPNEKLLDMTFDANLPTAGMCIRKEIFDNLKAKNWQAQLSGRIGSSQAPGEDSELCQAARLLDYKMFYTNELHFKHFMPKSRISWQRFLDMTYGFGVTDVFLLPYKLIYDKRKYGSNLKYWLRKHWFVNYFGKKATLFKAFLNFKLGKIDTENFEKIKARNSGFCETIWRENDKFNRSFIVINKLK